MSIEIEVGLANAPRVSADGELRWTPRRQRPQKSEYEAAQPAKFWRRLRFVVSVRDC